MSWLSKLLSWCINTKATQSRHDDHWQSVAVIHVHIMGGLQDTQAHTSAMTLLDCSVLAPPLELSKLDMESWFEYENEAGLISRPAEADLITPAQDNVYRADWKLAGYIPAPLGCLKGPLILWDVGLPATSFSPSPDEDLAWGMSISFCLIWFGPICCTWEKLLGPDISLERLSFLHTGSDVIQCGWADWSTHVCAALACSWVVFTENFLFPLSKALLTGILILSGSVWWMSLIGDQLMVEEVVLTLFSVYID